MKIITSILFVVTAAVLIVITLFSWPQERAIDLIYIVPDDFRGELVLRLHDPSGKESRPKGGRLVLDFSTSKPVVVSGADPLRGWCRQEAFFASGDRLAIFRNTETYPSENVLLDHDPASSDKAVVSNIFVGTKAEILDAREARLNERLGVRP